MIQKICATTRNSLDSICISAFIGLNVVAIYSNYYSLMNAIIGIIGIITTSITAGIGNSIVTETIDKNYNDMNKLNFIYMWISGWCTICLACLYQPFMKIWMGEEYMFSYEMVILFCIYFYSLKMGDIRAAYSDAKGLWWENRYRAILESIANIILNLILVHIWGICGIMIGTLLSLLIINFGYGSQIIFKYYFKGKNLSEYFLSHGKYALITTICGITTFGVCCLIKIDNIIGLFLKGMVCIIFPNILYYAIYSQTKIFKESHVIIFNITRKIPLISKLIKQQ